MSDITEIVSEITNNINIVLNKSLNKIISREDDVNKCLNNLPQFQKLINKIKDLENEILKLKKENEKINNEKNSIIVAYRKLFFKNHRISLGVGSYSKQEKISLNVSEKNHNPSNVQKS